MRQRKFKFDGHRFVVARSVFDPVRHLSGIAFAEQLDDVIADLAPTARSAVDIGTGTGLLAATLARGGLTVVATDISDRAVCCARDNCRGLDVEVRHGDLFEPLEGDFFDIAIVNPPYERSNPTWRRSSAFTSPRLLERLGERIHEFAPVAVMGFPVDDQDVLAVTGLDLVLWRTIATDGRDLGLYVSTIATRTA